MPRLIPHFGRAGHKCNRISCEGLPSMINVETVSLSNIRHSRDGTAYRNKLIVKVTWQETKLGEKF